MNWRTALATVLLLTTLSMGQGLDEAEHPCPVAERELRECSLHSYPTRGHYQLNLWPGGEVPYLFDANVTPANRQAALYAMETIAAAARVTFVLRGTQSDYVLFRDSTGNDSYVGRQGGEQVINIYNWNHRHIICHEIMHALGIWHEQQRADRDQYVQINYGNIVTGQAYNFEIPPGTTAHGAYDFESIMHYGQFAFSSNTAPTITVLPPYQAWQTQIGQRSHMSSGDGAVLRHLYGPNDDSCEENDTWTQACAIHLGTRTLELNDTEDYFTFTTANPMTLRVSAGYDPTEVSLQVRLHADGTTFIQSAGGLSGTASLVRSVAAGTYYVVIEKVAGISGSYTLTLSDDCYQWALRSSGDATPRRGHAMAYDAARQRSVVFGGVSDGGTLFRDTQAWDGDRWTLLSTSGPQPRYYHGMANDIARARVVLFGGRADTYNLGDTWEWNGSSWIQRFATGPSARHQHALAYDQARGRTVLFGGTDGSYLGDTWEWSGTAWTQRATTGPGPRAQHGMAYDAARQRTVLYGGYDAAPGFRSDTWEWDGTAWSLRSTTGPGERDGFAMTFDSARGRVVVFGGYTPGVAGDTWEWDGTTWTLAASTPAGPGARYESAMAFDTARGRSVLFGGTDGSAWASAVSEWNGASWTTVSTTAPGPRRGHALAFDAARANTVLFSGSDNGFDFYPDTQTWDGSQWTLRSASGPSGRYLHAMAFDAARGTVVLFGGRQVGTSLADTWEWNGTAWTQRIVAGPTARQSHAMAYDAHRQRIVLFGGDDGSVRGDTWEWDGATWTLASSTGPAARGQHVLGYDSNRRHVVLYGGYNGAFLDDTWEWDGAAWQQSASVGPAGRDDMAMGSDSARGMLTLFGGYNGGMLGDTWEWDGLVWKQRAGTGAGQPFPVYQSKMAYDTARDRMVLFGGSNDPSPSRTTWELTKATARLTLQPAPTVSRFVGEAQVFSVASSTGGLSYRWRRDGAALSDGPAGSGSSISGSGTPTLTVTNLHIVNSGTLDCILTNMCGVVVSQPSVLTVVCRPDIDGNGVLDPTDIALFVNKWFTSVQQSTLEGDFDNNGVVNPSDVAVFVSAWFATLSTGC